MKSASFWATNIGWIVSDDFNVCGKTFLKWNVSLLQSISQEARVAFDAAGLLLTAAVGAGKSTIDAGYEIDLIAQLV